MKLSSANKAVLFGYSSIQIMIYIYTPKCTYHQNSNTKVHERLYYSFSSKERKKTSENFSHSFHRRFMYIRKALWTYAARPTKNLLLYIIKKHISIFRLFFSSSTSTSTSFIRFKEESKRKIQNVHNAIFTF